MFDGTTGRITLGTFVLFGFLVVDLARHGASSPRLREYGFLLAVVALSACYCLLNDLVTYNLSPEYFRWGKGFDDAERSLALSLVLLATRVSWAPGLLVGVLYLLANNPIGELPTLPYRRFAALLAVPLAGAILGGTVTGALHSLYDPFSIARQLPPWPAPMQNRFIAVWGIHFGSYAGGAIGTLAGTCLVIRARRRLQSIAVANG